LFTGTKNIKKSRTGRKGLKSSLAVVKGSGENGGLDCWIGASPGGIERELGGFYGAYSAMR
jgi:hypothetical protein